MVKKVISYIMLIWLIGLPAVSQARTIKSITIDDSGMIMEGVSDPYLTRECKKFKPTVTQIKDYLTKAYPVVGFILNEDHYSPCYASGRVTFSNNQSGRWIVYSGGVAVIQFPPEERELVYYPDYDWQDPTTCTPEMSNGVAC